MTQIPDGFPPTTLPEAVTACLLGLDQTWAGRELVVNAVATVVREWLAGEVPPREALEELLTVLEADLQAGARFRAVIQQAMLTGDLDALKGIT